MRGSDRAIQSADVNRMVREHLNWVYASACRRVRDSALAEDVAQAVFLMLWRKLPRLGSEVKLTGWLYRAVQYCSANAMRQQRLRRRHEREAAMFASSTQSGDRQSDITELIETAVDSLAGKDRDAILLRFHRSMSLAEVGQAMGITEDAARMRVQRALEKLRGVLQSQGVTASVTSLGTGLLANLSSESSTPLATKVAATAGGTVSGAAGALATSASRMMWVAKAKVAAVVVAATVAIAGMGLVVSAIARPTTSGGAAAISADAYVTRTYSLPYVPATWSFRGSIPVTQRIRDQIIGTIAPGTWNTSGGGTIREADNRSLVITHTPAVHEQVAQLFERLREKYSTQITVETRLLTLSPDATPPSLRDPVTKQLAGRVLDDNQVSMLIRATQATVGLSVVTAPRITVFDGDESFVNMVAREPYQAVEATTRPDGSISYTTLAKKVNDGMEVRITPTASKDRSQVRVAFKWKYQKLTGFRDVEVRPDPASGKTIKGQEPLLTTMDVDTMVTIPAGKSMCLAEQPATILPEDVRADAPPGLVSLILVKPTVFVLKGEPASKPASSESKAQSRITESGPSHLGTTY